MERCIWRGIRALSKIVGGRIRTNEAGPLNKRAAILCNDELRLVAATCKHEEIDEARIFLCEKTTGVDGVLRGFSCSREEWGAIEG